MAVRGLELVLAEVGFEDLMLNVRQLVLGERDLVPLLMKRGNPLEFLKLRIQFDLKGEVKATCHDFGHNYNVIKNQ